jgi:hypothetical protein
MIILPVQPLLAYFLSLLAKRNLMKNISLKIGWFIMTVLLMAPVVSFAQDDKAAAVKSIIQEQHYVFKAETMLPASGITRQLTPEYDLRVSKDTIIAWLPYFGKSYSAPIDVNDAGIKFTSVKFDYTLSKGKKNRYEIDIRPKDQTGIYELSLTAFDNGSAILKVISTNRQPVTFYGHVTTK